MYGSQLVEKLVLDSKALGRLEVQKDLAAATVQHLADEASELKQTIGDMIREKKTLRDKPGENNAGELPASISRERTGFEGFWIAPTTSAPMRAAPMPLATGCLNMNSASPA